MQRQPRLCLGCGQELRYGTHCRACEDDLPHCPNCGDLLRVPHYTLPIGRCTTLPPEPELEQGQQTFI